MDHSFCWIVYCSLFIQLVFISSKLTIHYWNSRSGFQNLIYYSGTSITNLYISKSSFRSATQPFLVSSLNVPVGRSVAWRHQKRFSSRLVLGITNDFLQPGQNYSKMYGTEPRFNKPLCNEILVLTNTIHKSKRKIYLDITDECRHVIKDWGLWRRVWPSG